MAWEVEKRPCISCFRAISLTIAFLQGVRDCLMPAPSDGVQVARPAAQFSARAPVPTPGRFCVAKWTEIPEADEPDPAFDKKIEQSRGGTLLC